MRYKHVCFSMIAVLAMMVAALACDAPFEDADKTDRLGATETMQALATIVAAESNRDSDGGDSGEDTTSEEDSATANSVDVSATITPTESLTPTLGVPMVHVSVDTNCRFGPGDVYEYQGALLVGEEVPVTGKLADESFWYIENPDAPPPFCWIWGMYATVIGDKSGIPILTPPPTPTATPKPFSFQTEFGGAIPCGAYAFFARIENTGSVDIESLHLEVVDTDINLTNTHVNDIFATSVACTPSTTPRLQPGEVGYTFVSGFQTIQNHNFEATVKVCSQDGLAGECTTATFSVP